MRGSFLAAGAAGAFRSSVLADVLVVAGSIVGCLVIFENPGFLSLATNSDYLQLALNVWDYSIHDYAREGFEMSRVPSIVPDLVLYGAIQLATGSWRVASLGYAVFSLVGLTVVAGCIVNEITRCGWRTAAKVFLLLTLAILMFELPMTAASQHIDLFVPNNHGGPFILALGALCVAWSWLERPTNGKLLWLFVLIVAGVLSDLLFIIACVGPILAVLAYLIIRRRTTFKVVGLALSCILGGIGAARLLDLLLIREDVPWYRTLSVLENARAFLSSLGTLLATAPLSVLIAYVLSLIAFLLAFPLISRPREDRYRTIDAAEFWWIASVSSVFATFLVTALVYEDIASYRYTMPLRWWPIIWAAALLARALGPARSYVATTGLGGIAVVLGFAYFWQGLHAPALLTLHHPLEACLLAGQRTAGLKAGLADYWVSRSVAASSEWRLQIDQIEPDGSGQYYGNDRFWYTHDIHDGTRPPEYNYIVMTRLDESAIKARYGAPSRTLDCGSSAVWIYDDAAAVRLALAQGSPALYATFFEAGQGIDQICVPADRFYSRSHQNSAVHLAALAGPLEARVDTPDDQQPQIWGPHFALPRGRWVISLAYRLVTDAPGRDHWDITAVNLGRKKLFDGALAPTLGETRIVQAELDLRRRESDIEIRSFLAATGVVEVMGARIAQAGSSEPKPCGWQ